jgi:hypothetical protein
MASHDEDLMPENTSGYKISQPKQSLADYQKMGMSTYAAVTSPITVLVVHLQEFHGPRPPEAPAEKCNLDRKLVASKCSSGELAGKLRSSTHSPCPHRSGRTLKNPSTVSSPPPHVRDTRVAENASSTPHHSFLVTAPHRRHFVLSLLGRGGQTRKHFQHSFTYLRPHLRLHFFILLYCFTSNFIHSFHSHPLLVACLHISRVDDSLSFPT